MLTLEEQERAAYISGDIATAELVAHCIDEALGADAQLFEEQRDSAQKELDTAEARIEELEDRIADLEQSLRMT